MLEIEKLLVDHEGDTVCGENLEYDALLLEVREALEGKPEQRIDDDNVIEAEEPNWKLVKNNCIKLCGETHNLEVVVSLTQALMHLDGFSGLAEGSELLAGLVDKYWDCVHPQLDPDDNDPIERLNMFAIFEDFNYLLTVQKVVLISSKGVGSVSIYDIRQSKSPTDGDSNSNAVDGQLIEAIFKSSPDDQKESIYAYLEQSIRNFEKVSSLLGEEEYVGASNAPNFSGLLKILKEAKAAVGEYLGRPEEVMEGGGSDEQVENASSPIVAKPKGINNRQDVISAIQEIEEYYYKNEPGSPIPFLLQRAKNLVDKDFMSLMEDIAPDSLHQVGVVLGNNES